MKLMKLEEFVKLPAGTLYRKDKDGPMIQIKGDWVSDSGTDWTCTQFGDTVDTDKVYLEMFCGESYPLRTDYYGRDGCFDQDPEFLVYESWDLEQLRLIIDRAISVALPQKFKQP